MEGKRRSMTPAIHITTDADGFLLTLKRMTRETFAPAIDALKRAVPPYSRSFKPETKQWFVAFAAEPQMLAWLGYMTTAHAATVEFPAEDKGDEYERPPKPRAHRPGDAYAALHLLPTAPPSVVRAVYRELAKLNHPDLGGDVRAMQTINAAYRELAA
jgi:hypothetical protein